MGRFLPVDAGLRLIISFGGLVSAERSRDAFTSVHAHPSLPRRLASPADTNVCTSALTPMFVQPVHTLVSCPPGHDTKVRAVLETKVCAVEASCVRTLLTSERQSVYRTN